MQFAAGSEDIQIPLWCRSLSGAPLTGKAAADFSLTYRRNGENVEIALSDLASLGAEHSDGGIIEVGNGEYRLDLPDAAFAIGANKITVSGTVDGGVVLGYPIGITDITLAALAAACLSLTTRIFVTSSADDDAEITTQVIRGDTWVIPFTSLGAIAIDTEVYFTVKSSVDPLDTESKLQVTRTSGLLMYLGEEAGAGEDALGVITISDADVGDGYVTINPSISKLFIVGDYRYDFELISADGDVSTPTIATLRVIGDVTRAIS